MTNNRKPTRDVLATLAREVGEKYGVHWALVGPMIIDLVAAGYAAGLTCGDDDWETAMNTAFERGWIAARDQPNVSLVGHRKGAR